MSVRTLDITEATQPLSEYARQVDTGTIVVTAQGQPIVAVIAIENADLDNIVEHQSAVLDSNSTFPCPSGERRRDS